MTEPLLDPRLAAYRLLIADVSELVGRSRTTSDDMARGLGQSVARWHLMSVLSDQAISVASSARWLGLARQSVQRVANALLADGLVTSVPDPRDARAPLLGLTEEGRRLVTELYARSESSRLRLLGAAQVSEQALLTARSTVRALLAQFDVDETEATGPA